MTPGEALYRNRARIVLHNADEPCHNVGNIKHPRTQRLGADIPPRPEFRRFCDVCEWPTSRAELQQTMMTIPYQFRGD